MDRHNCFVHEGRELSVAEFNSWSQSIMAKNQDLRCFAKVVDGDGGAGTDPHIAELEKKLADKQVRLEAVQSSLIAARAGNPAPDVSAEIVEQAGRIAQLEAELATRIETAPTLEQALAIVEAKAPDRLKKKPGRKATSEVLEEV